MASLTDNQAIDRRMELVRLARKRNVPLSDINIRDAHNWIPVAEGRLDVNADAEVPTK